MTPEERRQVRRAVFAYRWHAMLHWRPRLPEDINVRLASAIATLTLGGFFFLFAAQLFGDHGWVGLLAAAAAVVALPRLE